MQKFVSLTDNSESKTTDMDSEGTYHPTLKASQNAANGTALEGVVYDRSPDYPRHDLEQSSDTLFDQSQSQKMFPALPKTLKGLHIQMIAIGGAVGSGLFVGSGGALAKGGPGNLILGFATIGIAIYFTMQALGELAIMYPIKGSFSAYSTRFIHPAWGFAMTWNYIMQWWTTLPLEISAAAITIQYWNSSLSPSLFVTLFLLFVAAINLGLGSKGYGDSEVVFSLIKVFAVLIFILMGIFVDVGLNPKHIYFGTKTWVNPGAFYNGFHGFCGMFVNAAFAFGGTELVGLACCETVEPHRTMPGAVKQVVWRIVLFYIVSLLVISFIVPYTNPNLLGSGSGSSVDTSPFVIAADLAGLGNGFSDFMNAIVLISTLSVGNSAVYGASRTVLAVVEHGQGPQWFGYTDTQGRPLVAIAVSLVFGVIAYVDNNSDNSVACFDWLLAISGLSALFTWTSICVAHIRFRAAWSYRGRSIEELPFQAQFGVTGSYIGCALNIIALVACFYTALYPVLGKSFFALVVS